MYKISFHQRALKQLKKLELQDQKKILKKIKQLKNNPTDFNLNIRRFYNSKKSWRIRAGNLRAIYTFDNKKKIIFVEYLGFRGSIYKKF